jgi:hypothetical protein
MLAVLQRPGFFGSQELCGSTDLHCRRRNQRVVCAQPSSPIELFGATTGALMRTGAVHPDTEAARDAIERLDELARYM